MIDKPKMTDEQRNHPALLWFVNSYLPRVGGNMTRAAEELGLSHKVLNALRKGTYDGDVAGQLSKLDEQRRRLSAGAPDVGCIQTQIVQRVWNTCDAAKAARLINWVIGQSQIGKTTAAREYAKMYPETTVLIRLSQKPTITSVLRELHLAARLPGVFRSAGNTLHQLRDKLTARHLIIVDEAHLALDRQQGADALDIIRELFDRCGCGVTLLVTDLDGNKVVRSPQSAQLEQLTRRGLPEILPATPHKQDVEAIWTAFGLGEPDTETRKTVAALVRRSCFGELFQRLRLAVAVCRREGTEMNWGAFNTALHRMERRLGNEH